MVTGAHEPKRAAKAAEDWTHVSTPVETADDVARANRALAELARRDQADRQRADDEARSRQLRNWHHERVTDHAVTQRGDDRALGRG